MSHILLLCKFYRTNPSFHLKSLARFSSDILPSDAVIPPSTSNLSKSDKKKLTEVRDEALKLQLNCPLPNSGNILRKAVTTTSFKQPSTEKPISSVVKIIPNSSVKSLITLDPVLHSTCAKKQSVTSSTCTKKECASKCKCNCKSGSSVSKAAKKSKQGKKGKKKSGPGLILSFFWLIIKTALTAGVIYTTIILKVWGSADDTNRLVKSLRESGYLPKTGKGDNPQDVNVDFQEQFRDVISNLAEEVHKIPERILQLYYFTENYFKKNSKVKPREHVASLLDEECKED